MSNTAASCSWCKVFTLSRPPANNEDFHGSHEEADLIMKSRILLNIQKCNIALYIPIKVAEKSTQLESARNCRQWIQAVTSSHFIKANILSLTARILSKWNENVCVINFQGETLERRLVRKKKIYLLSLLLIPFYFFQQ